MFKLTLLLILLPLTSIVSAKVSTIPNNSVTSGYALCGLSPYQTSELLKIYRGPVNGGYDSDHNGVITTEESFTRWDFNQIHDILEYGIEYQPYSWINVDTCFKFVATPLTFVEDIKNSPLLRTCRNFVFTVEDNYGNIINSGTKSGYACRNFATRIWKII